MKKRGIKRFCLGRKGKIVRNLSVAALLLTLLWVDNDCPAWTAEGALAREERRQLLSPGTVQYREIGNGDRVLVTGEGYVYTGIVRREFPGIWCSASILELVLLGDELFLLPWPRDEMWINQEERPAAVFCLNAPEGTARAEMTLTGDYLYTIGEYRGDVEHILERREETQIFHASGERLRGNLIRLEFSAQDGEKRSALSSLLSGSREFGQIVDGQFSRWILHAGRYQVNFYQADGGLVGSVQGDWENGGPA